MCSNFSLTNLGKKHLAATVGQALIKIYFNALFTGQPVDRRTRLSLESFVSTPMIIARGGGVNWGKGGRWAGLGVAIKQFFRYFVFFLEISKHSTGVGINRVGQVKLICSAIEC